MRRRFAGALGIKWLKGAARKVKEGGPLWALSAVGAVLEVHLGRVEHVGEGLDFGDVPKQAVGGVLDRPENGTVDKSKHTLAHEVVEGVGGGNSGSFVW